MGLYDLVLAVKVDVRIAGDMAVETAVATIAGAVMAGINRDFDRVAA
jgi:hypothetical protein